MMSALPGPTTVSSSPIGAAPRFGTAVVFVAFGDGVFPRLLVLDARDGAGPGPRLAGLDGLHRPAFELGGFVPDPVGVGDGDMPAFHRRPPSPDRS